jgi:hypothetical protein
MWLSTASSGQAATATRFRCIIQGGRGVAARSARTRGAVLYAQRVGSDRLFEVGALTSGCDGDGQKLWRPDFLRDGLAVVSKT